ncbi:MAG: tRNA 2-thiouridine(34) synthase MnmA [Proteobacteria bacterium]|nr:tRNA 2-thiouridine(34) synthase MnmA [Pseudomonadota bacterium]
MNSLGIDRAPGATRVVVAMSGGVDSSVVAGLLHEEGYEVVGVTLQLYDDGAARGKTRACCAGQDIHDARRVADHLGIRHYVLDYQSRFRESVIDDFAATYLRGETPIPCVRCNQTVKFRDLLATARDLGAAALATGHYVRRLSGVEGPELHRAVDRSRDQSYFLFATTPAQLEYLRFPLGERRKSETREIAARLGLGVSAKPDSQDICFVPNGSYADVVRRLHPEANAPGDIVGLDGAVLGRHQGIVHYTVGQRRGLGIGGGAALYVVRLEPETRRVVVGPSEALLTGDLTISEVNWIGAQVGEEACVGEVEVKVRSAHMPVSARVQPLGGGRAKVILDQPESGVAPGQACVMYRGDRVLGGGWIERADVVLAA